MRDFSRKNGDALVAYVPSWERGRIPKVDLDYAQSTVRENGFSVEFSVYVYPQEWDDYRDREIEGISNMHYLERCQYQALWIFGHRHTKQVRELLLAARAAGVPIISYAKEGSKLAHLVRCVLAGSFTQVLSST